MIIMKKFNTHLCIFNTLFYEKSLYFNLVNFKYIINKIIQLND